MKANAFDEKTIMCIRKVHAAGARMSELSRRYKVSENTLYKMRSKYGGMEVSKAKRPRGLKAENAKLKRLLADSMPENVALKDVLSNKMASPLARLEAAGYLKAGYRMSERRACAALDLSRAVKRYRPRRSSDKPLRAQFLGAGSPIPAPQLPDAPRPADVRRPGG